jgi:integrase/recombinase XerD
LRTFYRYLAVHNPEMLAEAQRVEAIPTKRTQAAKTVYLERDEIDALFQALPRQGSLALRDRTLLMFLYNTGARVQEAADVRAADLDLNEPYRVRLHGKGDKWRSCPIWPETAQLLKQLMAGSQTEKSAPVFVSQQRKPLTRFGIYKIVKRHTTTLKCGASKERSGGLFPHAFRHYLPFLTMSSDMDGSWRSFNNGGSQRRWTRLITRHSFLCSTDY